MLVLNKLRQETGYYCGPAVLSMLLNGLGKDVEQSAIVSAAKLEPKEVSLNGMEIGNLAMAVKSLFADLQVWCKRESSIRDIMGLLKAGMPVAVDWQGVFDHDEYGDELWHHSTPLSRFFGKFNNDPETTGDQGHYVVVVDLDIEAGWVKFVDPYGHYAGKERFLATWEFEERWWDDRLGLDESGKKVRILENRLLFVVTSVDAPPPEELELVKV